MRAVLDANVLISALLAPQGAPARLVARWLAGGFELIASERLLVELRRALGYSKLRARVPTEEAAAYVELVRSTATMVPDPPDPPRRSRDPGDDYLLALAANSASVLVSGDQDLLDLASDLPIYSPAGFLVKMEA